MTNPCSLDTLQAVFLSLHFVLDVSYTVTEGSYSSELASQCRTVGMDLAKFAKEPRLVSKLLDKTLSKVLSHLWDLRFPQRTKAGHATAFNNLQTSPLQM